MGRGEYAPRQSWEGGVHGAKSQVQCVRVSERVSVFGGDGEGGFGNVILLIVILMRVPQHAAPGTEKRISRNIGGAARESNPLLLH